MIWQAWKGIAGVELPTQEFWVIPVKEIGPAVALDRHLRRTGKPIDPREVDSLDARTYRSAA